MSNNSEEWKVKFSLSLPTFSPSSNLHITSADSLMSVSPCFLNIQTLICKLVGWGRLRVIVFCFVFYFWLHWVFVAACRLSLVVVSRGYSSLWCAGFSLWWLLLLRSTGSWCAGFSSCGTWAQFLWRMGLVAPQHLGSSRTRARIRVPCIGRQILNHCATREALFCFFFK